jgi:hypothetical protein
MIKYISYSISITVLSWIAGMIFSSVFKKTEFYKKLSHLNWIKSETLNKRIGLKPFKWIVKNTFFKYFNPKLKLKNKVVMTELDELRTEMTFSEISHLAGFGFVTIFAFVKLITGNYILSLTMMIVNVLLNLYPSLLQQENKKRIDQFMKKYR